MNSYKVEVRRNEEWHWAGLLVIQCLPEQFDALCGYVVRQYQRFGKDVRLKRYNDNEYSLLARFAFDGERLQKSHKV